MAKPVILCVDDEPQVLNAINRDIRRHFGKEYRVLRAGSGSEALETVKQLKQRNEQIVLFLSDQRMPEMTGTEFLTEARQFYPDARKVLLTAYADTEAAIDSINTIELDYYLMKPWDPPELNLYPVIEDLINTWWLEATLPYDGIRVAGTLWSASSHSVKDFLSRNRIPYQWLDVELNSEANKLVESVLGEDKQLPVVFFPDGTTMIRPGNRELAEKVGLRTEASLPHYDMIIIGGGPAGLGAGVYGASEGLKTLMIEKEATGGQAGTSSRIENYLGFPKGLSGAELSKRATDQAIRLGCEILTAVEVVSVRLEDQYKIVTLSDGKELSCKALIIATGVQLRRLEVPGCEMLAGAGVYYGAALTEAANYKDKQVFVVGGANSAGQGAMYFARYAKKVTMLVRGSSLEAGMSQYLVDQINAEPNIEVLLNTTVTEMVGNGRLKAIKTHNSKTDQHQSFDAQAVFIFIGATACTDVFRGIVQHDEQGFIITGQDLIKDNLPPPGWKLKRFPLFLETSVPGIFAAGDVRYGAVRRVASAVGQGAIAVALVHQYLKEV